MKRTTWAQQQIRRDSEPPKPRTCKPLDIPEPQAVLAQRLAILVGHGMFQRAREVIDAEELAWESRRLEEITLDSPLSSIPGINPRAVACLENVGVNTLKEFLSYYHDGTLQTMRQVGPVTIQSVLDGIRLLPSAPTESPIE